ncbi:hypothetical protein L226DRAFT_493158 [Lentinus tigrinus ALCF2SS1-7]|uniref:uncharacterized protein n=1 Tax=Lentinus tigrinus ALCF2SS1-7 TaxID=1328758 RepID=UPI001165E4A0|nr:hypothetical protein L226DRAFT_493158 [Lentinus tigrinus ALCF2SS1-7]
MPSDATEAALGLLGLTGAFPSPSPSTIPAKRKQPATVEPSADSNSSESIYCICGFSDDDGFSICCDSCQRWCHAACFSIVENEVPDEWQCWECAPRPVDRDRAVKLQKARRRLMANGAQKQRRASPGVERKPRKPSAAAGEGAHKRKRRASINTSVAIHTHAQAEDEHVDIDEPMVQSFVPITKDIVTDDARDRLRRVASDWRGITAISPTTLTPGCTTPALLTPDELPGPLHIPTIAVQPVPTSAASFPSIFANGNASVRPLSYAIHATQPITSSKLIAPYPSTIIPTASYLRDPLNAYAHLGMPKPYVHLFGPPLDVALDARITGDQSRFVRNGCRPNAVLRPMFCPSKHPAKSDDEAVKFGIFALRDLKANEEVVLGWEWDDENVVHHLPALIQSPFSFPPHQVQHFRNQMTSMLHTLASTFTTCACGSKARDCVLTRIAEFVENQTPLTPSPSPPSQFTKDKHRGKAEQAVESPIDLGPLIGIERGFRTRERIPFSGGMGGVELVPPSPLEAGPSRLPSGTRKVSFPDDLLSSSNKLKGKDRKGKGRAEDVHDESDVEGDSTRARARRHSEGSSEPMAVDAPPQEARLPPRLRKSWIAKSVERLREHSGLRDSDVDMHSPALSEGSGRSRTSSGRDESYFDSRDMPPPPVPPSRTPPLGSSISANHAYIHAPPLSASSSSSSTGSSSSKLRLAVDGQGSPSIPFSKLSLLSPVILPPPHASRSDSRSPPISASSSAPIASQSASSSSKSTVKASKARRPTQSPQPPSTPDAEKPPKPTKSRAKGKDKDKEGTKEKGKAREKGESTNAKKTPRPRTPATENENEADEPATALKPSLLRREDVLATKGVKGRKSASPAVNSPREPATALKSPREPAAVLTSPLSPATGSKSLPLPPSSTVPEPPPDPPDAAKGKEDAMDVDEPPPRRSSPEATVGRSAVPDMLQILAAAASSVPSVTRSPVAPSLPSLPQVEASVAAQEASSEPPVAEPQDEASATEPPLEHTHDVVQSPAESMEALPVPEPTPAPAPSPAPVSDAPHPLGDVPPPEPAPAPVPSASQLFDDPAPEPSAPPLPELAPPPPTGPAPLAPEAEPAAAEPTPEPEPPKAPPPPPKVKLSLKDFAMRKKKQREEEQKEREKEKEKEEHEKEAAEHITESGSAVQSPAMDGDAALVASPASVRDAPLPVPLPGPAPVSPVVHADVGPSVQEEQGGAKAAAVSSSPVVAVPEPEAVVDAQDKKVMEVDGKAEVPDADGDVKMDEAQEQEHNIDSTAPQASIPEPERKDAAASDVGAHKSAASPSGRRDVLSPTTPAPNGHYRDRSPSPSYHRPSRIWSRTPPPREVNGFAKTFEAKVELLDSAVPSGLVAPAHDDTDSLVDMRNQRSPSPIHRVVSPAPVTPRTSPKMAHSRVPLPSQPSQEDGEILSPPPPKSLSLAPPRSHSPPTHPRHFYSSGGLSPTRPSPGSLSQSSARAPLHPAYHARNSPTAASRLPPPAPPSAPRALRQGGAYGGSSYVGSGGQNAPYYGAPPRGPSADRDRDRDRSRDWGRDRDRDVDRVWHPGPSRGRGRGGTWR